MKTLPEITFARGDPQAIELEVVSTIEELMGRPLERADPLRIFLRGVELLLIQQRLLIDETAKQNLLAYAVGDALDHLGALVGCERLEASAATTTLELTLSASRSQSTTIAKGTRVSAGDAIFFATDAPAVFTPGTTSVEVKATCTTLGVDGNNYLPGELKRIVDPQPFLSTATNLTTTEGGSDIEDDDHYRTRIRESLEAFSVAGSEGAYKYHAKSVSALISDVAVTSPTPGCVNVYVLLTGGQLPGAEMLKAVDDHLNKKTVRPLTDNVEVLAPEIVSFDVDLTYWVSRDDSTLTEQIEAAVTKTVDEYVTWQASVIGRDLNPTELIYRLKQAGVKRCEVSSPTFQKIEATEVAKAVNVSATFAGLEDE